MSRPSPNPGVYSTQIMAFEKRDISVDASLGGVCCLTNNSITRYEFTFQLDLNALIFILGGFTLSGILAIKMAAGVLPSLLLV